MTCVCGHAVEEHPTGGLGPSACVECECIQYEPEEDEGEEG